MPDHPRLDAFRLWARGLIGAAVNGAATAVSTMVIDPTTFNMVDGKGNLGKAAGISAVVGAALYLKQSPLPALPTVEVKVGTVEVKEAVVIEQPKGNGGAAAIPLLVRIAIGSVLIAAIIVGARISQGQQPNMVSQSLTVGPTPQVVGIGIGRVLLDVAVETGGGPVRCGPWQEGAAAGDQPFAEWFEILTTRPKSFGVIAKGQYTAQIRIGCYASTDTVISILEEGVPAFTPTVTQTHTVTRTPTRTPTFTNTPTRTPTNTQTPTRTPTNTRTPTATNTRTPTNTP